MTRIIRNRNERKPISANLSQLMANRHNRGHAAPIPPPASTLRSTRGEGEVANIDADATVLGDILSRTKYEPRKARQTGYLHVSDLLGKCIRRIALLEQHEVKATPQRLSLTDSLTFGMGDAIHDIIKARAVLSAPRQIWGKWSCKCGTTKHDIACTLSDFVETCPACKGPVSVYDEVTLRDEDLKIVGHPDLILYMPDLDALHVTELKSIAHDRWKDMSRPLPDHVIQVLFYWYLMKKLGYRVTDRCTVLYVTKGWQFSGDPYKEFSFNPEEIVHRLEPFLDDARALKAARAGGPLPTRVCASDMAPDAKKCDMCSICFGGADAAPKKISIADALGRPRTPIRRTR